MHEAETPPWIIHSERVVDDTRRAVLSIAEVELPDGTRFEQWVHRSPAAAMAALVVDDAVLMLHRHRFVIDRWIFELPGGYCEPGETLIDCAAREAEEETGWRPVRLELLASFQPWVATADAEQHVFVSYGAEQITVDVDVNEAATLHWVPLKGIPSLIASGAVTGSASMVGLQAVLLQRAAGQQQPERTA
ncbi:NUDIX hydrolase [Glycomyces sp. A-F 0318]|uniref:NUDIX hydrolase n=1 Tax=Glycomyces amatae TaxID=2881355 RepID=UPI001E4AEF97|nr:NUDIX hydrolase [Glycomyces amatae]MCD0446318.1 NUDIX hydrolase [Glycomyces amatae]